MVLAISSKVFSVSFLSSALPGIIATVIQVAAGIWWLERRRKTAQAKGEGYGNHTLNEPRISDTEGNYPDWKLSLLPLIAVVAINYALTTYPWDPGLLKPFQGMGLKLISPAIKNIAGVWSLIIGLVVGVFLAVIIGYKYLPKDGGLQRALNTGAIGSLLAIMNTASEVGYGNVISSLPGFKSIADFLLAIKIGGTPLASEFVTVNILAGITGSASGGMSIALSVMAKDWLTWANQVGFLPKCSIASLPSPPAVWIVCPTTALSSLFWQSAA
jgi:H+/gluconate symporter-like permease